MTEALDSDTDPNNVAAPFIYEPYYYRDNAAITLDIAQKRFAKEHGDDALHGLVWGVKKVPRPPLPPDGG